MLGYICPDKEELKLRELRTYRNYYCVLCRQLGKSYGLLFRAVISNDLTFFLICLDALTTGEEEIKYRCPFNPTLHGHLKINCDALAYTAFLNVYLIYQKCIDLSKDGNSALERAAGFFFGMLIQRNRKFRQERSKYQSVVEKLDNKFAILYQLEQHNDSSFDEITNLFGEIVSIFPELFLSQTSPENATNFQTVLFNMGKWAYIADALDDYLKDISHNEFNLLSKISGHSEKPSASEQAQTVSMLLTLLQRKIQPAEEHIQWRKCGAIVENILYNGCWKTAFRIFRKNHQKESKKR